MDFIKLNNILDNGTTEELAEFCKTNKLIINNGRIFHSDVNEVTQAIEYWDKRQLVKKIVLNS